MSAPVMKATIIVSPSKYSTKKTMAEPHLWAVVKMHLIILDSIHDVQCPRVKENVLKGTGNSIQNKKQQINLCFCSKVLWGE